MQDFFLMCFFAFLLTTKCEIEAKEWKKIQSSECIFGQKRKKAAGMIFRSGFVLTSDSSEFSVFANFVGGSSADRVAIDVDNGLLPHVHPNDRSILGPFVTTSLIFTNF